MIDSEEFKLGLAHSLNVTLTLISDMNAAEYHSFKDLYSGIILRIFFHCLRCCLHSVVEFFIGFMDICTILLVFIIESILYIPYYIAVNLWHHLNMYITPPILLSIVTIMFGIYLTRMLQIQKVDFKKYIEKQTEENICKICMNSAVNTIFLPCGHFVSCNLCAVYTQVCPICRGDIKSHNKVYK